MANWERFALARRRIFLLVLFSLVGAVVTVVANVFIDFDVLVLWLRLEPKLNALDFCEDILSHVVVRMIFCL